MVSTKNTQIYCLDGQKVAVPLYGFQRRWLADRDRFKFGLMCRQIGKSFIAALEVVDDAIETGQDWVLLSAGERQSKELMQKVQTHCRAYAVAASDIDETFFEDTRYTLLTITLPNGARIMGLPANPDTARGFSANVVLDEFAFHKDSAAIWKALFPTISRGYKIRIVTTPQGKANKAHEIWTADNGWSKHFVDIHQAVADGVPHNIEELKAGLDDEDAWNQEFLILFIDEASTLLSYELIASCQDETLKTEFDYADFDINSFVLETTNPLYIGYDVGRKKDRSVLWLNELVGDVYTNRLLLTFNNIKFADQKERLWDIITKLKVNRANIDETGLGMQLAEETVDRFDTYRIEAVTFTSATKNDMATRMLRGFEDRRIRIPVSRVLRDDLHSVKKVNLPGGGIRYDAERTREGHADRFWAGGLSLRASDEPDKPQVFISTA